MVTQIWLMAPAPLMSAIIRFSPGLKGSRWSLLPPVESVLEILLFLTPDFNFAKSNISFVMFDCAKTAGKYNPKTRESNKLNFVILLMIFCLH